MRRLLATLVFGSLLAAHPAAGSSLDLAVRHTFGGEPLQLDSLRYQNGAGETISVSRLSYLLTGFAVERDDGEWIELPGQVAWMDAPQQRTGLLLSAVPDGKYRALRFYLGPDAETNASNPARFPADHPLNPSLNGLHWSWQGGYIFLALEGHYRDSSAELKGYSCHLARDANRKCVVLAAALDLTRDRKVSLDFDLAALLNAPRPLSFSRDGAATHSRNADPVAAALVGNLPGAFRVREITSSPRDHETLEGHLQPLYLPERFTPFRFTMSATFPMPALPADNPLLVERVALGERLFREPLMSRTGTVACSTCHDHAHALADPRRVSLGVNGQAGTRNAMPLFNLAWKSSFFWDGRAPSLRAQALMPIQDHREMDERLEHVAARLASVPDYPALFTAAFGCTEITPEKIGLALENFLLTQTSCDSKFDRAMRGQTTLSVEEQRGAELFFTEYDPRTRQFGADCFHCHGGALFSDYQFHNNGLGDVSDPGRSAVTGRAADRGKFATPSLRNVALTTPYMHDGRFATLEAVVAHYASGGVVHDDTLDPNLAKHPAGGLPLNATDQAALVAFLRTLTDARYSGSTE